MGIAERAIAKVESSALWLILLSEELWPHLFANGEMLILIYKIFTFEFEKMLFNQNSRSSFEKKFQ